MVIHKTFKFRIYPNKEQQQQLAKLFGCCRFVYNYYLALRRDTYKETGKGVSYNKCCKHLTQLKRDPNFEWLGEATAQCLQQALRDLDQAFVNFFEGGAGYPKFKSKHSKQSARYPQGFKVDDAGKRIRLPKIGWVRAVIHRPYEGKMKSCTVSKSKSGKYFASIICEVTSSEPEYTGDAVGIDMGLTHFATLSTGEKIDNPRYLGKAQKRIKRAQRALSRKKKGSNNRKKAKVQLSKRHEKVANQRRDFQHKLSRRLVNENQIVSMENLNITGMMANHHLAQSIADASWGEFKRQLEYKGEWYGCEVETIDRFFPSTKTCHSCGFINKELTLKEREWTCPECGTELDRDMNAAINILNQVV